MVGVAALFDDARSAGLDLCADGDRLVVRGPKEARSVAQRILAHKTEIMSVLRGWGAETADLIAWFDVAPAPAESFRLRPGITITDPAQFWRDLRSDIAAGPHGARNRYGAVEADLRQLHNLMTPEREAA